MARAIDIVRDLTLALRVFAWSAIRSALKKRLHRDPGNRRVKREFTVFVKQGGLSRIADHLVRPLIPVQERLIGKPCEEWNWDELTDFYRRITEVLVASKGATRGRPAKLGFIGRVRRYASKTKSKMLFEFADNFKKEAFAAKEGYTPDGIEQALKRGQLEPEEIDTISAAAAVRAFIERFGLDPKLEQRLRKHLSRRRVRNRRRNATE
jgi:hypothetical protein